MQMNQEQLQQQLGHAKAACKAAETNRAQSALHHQAQLAELRQQLEEAKQCSADLQALHQQDLAEQLAEAAAATAQAHQQEVDRVNSYYSACLSHQATAMAELQQEVALLTAETEGHTAAVAQSITTLHEDSCSSQSQLQQQVQQVRAELASLCSGSISSGSGGDEQEAAGLEAAVNALKSLCAGVQAEGCSGIGGLLQAHHQLKAQASRASLQ